MNFIKELLYTKSEEINLLNIERLYIRSLSYPFLKVLTKLLLLQDKTREMDTWSEIIVQEYLSPLHTFREVPLNSKEYLTFLFNPYCKTIKQFEELLKRRSSDLQKEGYTVPIYDTQNLWKKFIKCRDELIELITDTSLQNKKFRKTLLNLRK